MGGGEGVAGVGTTAGTSGRAAVGLSPAHAAKLRTAMSTRIERLIDLRIEFPR